MIGKMREGNKYCVWKGCIIIASFSKLSCKFHSDDEPPSWIIFSSGSSECGAVESWQQWWLIHDPRADQPNRVLVVNI